jgi:CarD family transcriptional regulator
MFKKGELVVYPAHGIGRIEDVQVKLVDGEERLFLVVRIIENEMKILLPVTNAKHVGVRPLIDRDEIPQIFEVLKKREISVVSASWNKRYREYKDQIRLYL